MSAKARKTAVELRSKCPVCGALDVLGDKWTLLIVRDMLYMGKTRYGQFAKSLEGIPTNILADRLKKMQRFGLITAKLYQKQPPRYEYHLTPMGEGLRPVLAELMRWSNAHIPGTMVLPPGVLDQT